MKLIPTFTRICNFKETAGTLKARANVVKETEEDGHISTSHVDTEISMSIL